MATCTKMVLGNFTGTGDANSFIRRFELLAAKDNWGDDEKRIRLAFALTDQAGIWYANLTADKIDTYAHLLAEFKKHYIDNEPTLVTESKLLSRKLLSGESLEDYYDALVALGNKLGRKPTELGTQFINGLPDSYKDWVLSTDSHTLDSYLARAKLFQARHPERSVTFQGSFPVQGDYATKGEMAAVVKTLKESLDALNLRSHRSPSRHSRSPSRSPNRHRSTSRHRSPNRYRSSTRHRSPSSYSRGYRPRYRSPHRYRPQQGSGRSQVQCYYCKKRGHIARQCYKLKGKN